MLKKLFLIIDLSRAYLLASSNIDNALFLLNRQINVIKKYENKFPDYYILKGSILFALENYSEAQKDLERATELLIKNEYYNLDEKNICIFISIIIYLIYYIEKKTVTGFFLINYQSVKILILIKLEKILKITFY